MKRISATLSVGLLAAVLTAISAAGLAGMAVAGPLEDGKAAYDAGDSAAALRLWRPLAEQGQAAAQYWLGMLYGLGRGVPRDEAEAVKWTRLAAAQGHLAAQHVLKLMYSEDQGEPLAYAEAVQWFGEGRY